MASFLTNLGRKHKISKRWLLGMPTSVKVEGLSTLHRLQTCICSETTPQDFQSLRVSFCKSGTFLATDHGGRLARMAATANFSKPDLPNPDRRQTRILLMPAPTTIHDHGPIWFLAPHALQLHRYRSIFYRTYDSPLAQYFFRPSSVAAGRHPPCFIFIKH